MATLIQMISAFLSSLAVDRARKSNVASSRNLAYGDNGKILVVNPATKNTVVTLTIPTGLATPFMCSVRVGKQGRVVIAKANGVTFPFDAKQRTMRRKGDHLTLRATSSDEYTLEDNETSGFGQKVAPPTLSPTPGTYDSAQSVTLVTATIGATIYYTLDGSTPSIDSTEYTGAISVAMSKTLKIIAVAPGAVQSDMVSVGYTIIGTVWDATTMQNDDGSFVLSNSNRTVTCAAGFDYIRANKSWATGKHYFETTWTFGGADQHDDLVGLGLIRSSESAFNTNYNVQLSTDYATTNGYVGPSSGWTAAAGLDDSAHIVITSGQTIRTAYDAPAGKVWMGDESIWYGGGDPAAGTNPTFTVDADTDMQPFTTMYAPPGANSITLNSGDSVFAYTVPAGYSAWSA